MKKILSFILLLSFLGVLIPTFVPLSVRAMTGSGTEGDPYIIYNVTDLQDMNNDLDAYYELANDIDASDTLTWNGGAGFLPIGSGAEFTGYFDGEGHEISDLYIDRSGAIGLFSTLGDYIGAGANVSNLGLVNPIVHGTHEVGCLAGVARAGVLPIGDIYISNCWIINGTVSGLQKVGGLIGYVYDGPMSVGYCTFTGIVYETGGTTTYDGQNFGGLIGSITHAGYIDGDITIYRCATAVSITVSTRNPQSIGGLIGNVYCDRSPAGEYASIEECYSLGTVVVTTSQYDIQAVGGLVGFLGDTGSEIKNCYSRVDVSINTGHSTYKSGGLVGHMGNNADNLMENSYSTGSVSGTNMGGLIGSIWPGSGTVTDSFWDTETSGWPLSAGGTGKTTAEMKTRSTFTGAGWDFDDVWAIKASYNDGYPYLRWDGPFIWEGDYDFYQVLWFQPNDLIYGTTLPDRMENQDGDITWGDNPAGIVIDVGSLVSAIQPAPWVDTEEPGIRDALPEAEAVNWFVEPDMGALATNPLRPFVTILSDNSTLTEWQAWRYLGLIFVIFCTALAAWKLRGHLFIAGVTCALAMAILVQQTIWPLWTVVFVIAAIVAGLIAERTPQV